MSHIHRRHFLARGLACGLGGAAFAAVAPSRLAWALQSEVAPEPRGFAGDAPSDWVTPAAQRAIDRALAYLAERQNSDGSFGRGHGRNLAVCSLAGMAFMACGYMPSRGQYGEEIDRTLEYVLAHCQESGFIGGNDAESRSHGPMYGHGFATLFLAEAYGMTGRTDVRERLSRAVKLIVNTQNDQGGWRYEPKQADADISVTICQIMALRAARNAGIYVPNETVDLCIDYVKRSQNPDGGFMYMLTEHGGPSAFARSAAGIVALYSAGIYDGEEISKGLDYVMHYLPSPDSHNFEPHYFYGQYYAVQAMWHAGGEYWERWYPAIRETLLARQLDDGSWTGDIAPEYGTAMATIILQMPNNYLPIFQR